MNKILIYSDCFIYGGSERLMAFLLANKTVKTSIELVYSYRRHKAYDRGLRSDILKFRIDNHVYPLPTLGNESLFYRINCSSRPSWMKAAIKAPFYLLRKTGIYFLVNFCVCTVFLIRTRPRAVHINNGGYPGALSCNHMLLAARFLGIGSVLYQVNNIAWERKGLLGGWYDKMVNKKVRYFITASGKAGDALVHGRGFDRLKMRIIPNAVVDEDASLDRPALLDLWKFPDSTFLLVQVGFLTARKGQIHLLKAMAGLKDDPDLKLILVGNGEDEVPLKEFVREAGLNNSVIFAGYQSNSADYIRAADIFILPSVANEDMPLALLTAMSYGRPIIASRFAGIADALTNQESGVLVEPDPQTLSGRLADAIERLRLDKAFRMEIGKGARVKFEQDYSEEVYGKKMVAIYNEMLT